MAALRVIRRWRSERGAELVEFAIVMPVLVVMLTGIVDFALLFHSWEVTTNAAREGARLAVLPGYDVNGYQAALNRVDDYIEAGGARGSYTRAAELVPVSLGPGVAASSGVRVTVTYTHNFLLLGPVIGLLNGTFRDSVTYSTSAVMRTEVQSVVPTP
jgi:Flp pilus assembly protein TadG